MDKKPTHIGTSTVVHVTHDTDIRAAARLMVREHVGALIVKRAESAIGLVTDRDLTLAVLLKNLDPQTTPVETCMSSPLIQVEADATLEAVAQRMREHHVRRIARVNEQGEVMEIIALDDVVATLGRRWSTLARMVDREIRREPDSGVAQPSTLGSE